MDSASTWTKSDIGFDQSYIVQNWDNRMWVHYGTSGADCFDGAAGYVYEVMGTDDGTETNDQLINNVDPC